MKWKVIVIIFFIIFGLANFSFSQQWGSKANLVPLGVITPDGGRMIFQMSGPEAAKLSKALGIRMEEGGVPYVWGHSWRAVAQVAKASSEDLSRTVADLVVRVDALEKKVSDLEKKIK